MRSPSLIIIDARNVERDTQCSQALRIPAPLRERQGGQQEQLRQTQQLRLCYEQCREILPDVQIDIFINRQHYMDAYNDENLKAVREADSEAFHKVPSGADVDQMLLAHALAAKDDAAAVISNDLFRDHIRSGYVSAEWIQKHVWKFMFVRGKVVLPQLVNAPKDIDSDAEESWTMRHERQNDSGTPTHLRQEPDADSSALPGVIVASFEKVSILRMRSEMANGCPTTWALISCRAGEGWLRRTHLHETLTLWHKRTDDPLTATSLRLEACLLTLPAQDLKVEPLEVVSIISAHTEITSASPGPVLWVKVACVAGAGWLQRKNLTVVAPENQEPRPKRQKTNEHVETRQYHLRNLGYGESGHSHIQDLRALLTVHGVTLKHHSEPRERARAQPMTEIQEVSVGSSEPMGPPGRPPLARWFVHELSLEAPKLYLERLLRKQLALIVDSVLMEFKPPLDKTRQRNEKPRGTYTERSQAGMRPSSISDRLHSQVVGLSQVATVSSEPACSQAVPLSLSQGHMRRQNLSVQCSQAAHSQASEPFQSSQPSQIRRMRCDVPCSQAVR